MPSKPGTSKLKEWEFKVISSYIVGFEASWAVHHPIFKKFTNKQTIKTEQNKKIKVFSKSARTKANLLFQKPKLYASGLHSTCR